VIYRFKWSVCCTLSLVIQLVLIPVAAIAAGGKQAGGDNSGPAPFKEPFERVTALTGPADRKMPAQPTDSAAAALPAKQDDGLLPIATGFAVPAKRTLAELIGMSKISVLADVDGQFVKKITELQVLAEERASQVGEAGLVESIRAGRGFSRESLAALARTEQAKAQTGQAFALLLPSVSIRASYGNEISNPSVNVDVLTEKLYPYDSHSRTDFALTVRQPLFDLPSYRDWRRREVVEQARGENYRVSDGDTYVSVVNSYLSLVSSRLQIDMTRDFENQLAELLAYIEKRASAGAASVSDSARVRARSQATLSSRLEQESAHAAAGIEFVRLTNLVPQKVRVPVLEDVGVSLLPESFDKAVAAAMSANPEIAALNAEVQAAILDNSAAKSRFLPRVDAEYTNSYSQGAGGDTSAAGQKDKRIMMVLNWSLFSGGSDYKYFVERTERLKELQYRLDDQRRRVIQTLSANFATLATTRERINSGYQELQAISTAAEAMSKRMLSGNQSLLDLLDVYDRFYQVRSRLLGLHILEMSTVTQLVRLTLGTPGPSEVKAEPAPAYFSTPYDAGDEMQVLP
jgi:adhesin transport system outer membrane protein